MLFFGKKKKKEKELKRKAELAKQVEIEKAKLEEEKKQQEANKIASKSRPQKVAEPKNPPVKKPVQKKEEPKKSPSGKYEIYPEAGFYKYRLKASNGEILAVSFGYSTKKGAESGIETFKKNVKSGVFELSTDKSGYSFYTLFNSTGARAVVIGEFYNNLKQAESAVESVKNFYQTDKIAYLDKIPEAEVREEIIKVGKIEPNSNGKYEVFKENGQWFVRLRASNAEILFNSQAYASKSSALSGLETIKNAVEDKNFTIAKDKQNRYQFKLYSTRKQLILSGETYPVKRSCVSAIDSVVRFSGKAKTVEMK